MTLNRLSLEQEQQLIAELSLGNEKAFESIFRIYWRPLYLHAISKLNDTDEAEEIVQSVFSSLWEQREQLEIENLNAYLYRCVRNRILNTIRSKITEQKYWSYYRAFIPNELNATEQAVAFDALQEDLLAAVNHLPEKSRKVFQLSRFEGRSNNEIARLLKISEKSIEYHITKSVKELKLLMKDYILFAALLSIL